MNAMAFDVAVLGDTPTRINEVLQAMGSAVSYKIINVTDPPQQLNFEAAVEVVNVDLRSVASVAGLKRVLQNMPNRSKSRIFALNAGSHLEVTQGNALGATEIMGRPIEGHQLISRVGHNLDANLSRPPLNASTKEVALYTGAVLKDLMLSAVSEAPLNLKNLDSVGDQLVKSVTDSLLSDWITTVRQTHSQTYEHSLSVTAVAISFGFTLGFSDADLIRVATSSLLHDTGKAFLPLSILEKPGALDQDEVALIQAHPALGHDALLRSQASSEILDVALNHHEYLDGSGYPKGLKASQISDLVRVVTISDIFGALIEQRSYKRPMHPKQAYDVLLGLGPKLDMPLVKAFKPVAEKLSRL